MSYLYHYTDSDGIKAILQSGYIRKSSGPGDAAFGEGVYLTAMPPDSATMEILLNNWDSSVARLKANPQAIKKTEYCIAFPMNSIPNVKKIGSGQAGSRDVWLYPGDLTLSGKNVQVYVRK